MFDSRPGPSGVKRSLSEEPETTEPKKLITEEQIRDLIGGDWTADQDDSEFTGESPDCDQSDEDSLGFGSTKQAMDGLDQKLSSQVPPGWPDDSLSKFIASHFLEGSGSPSPPQCSPLSFLDTVLPAPIVELIVTSTNQNAEILKLMQKKSLYYSSWKHLSDVEFKIFLGLLYHMEIIRLPSVKDYWSMSRLFSIPIFQNMMPRNRFLAILGALSFNVALGESDESVEQFYKVKPLVDHFNNLMTTVECSGMETVEDYMKEVKDNQLFESYGWNKRVGIHLLHTLLYVGWLLYNDQCGPEKVSFKAFRLTIVDGLLAQFPPLEAQSMSQGEKPHYMSYIGINEKGKKRRKRCKYCMENRNKRKESYFCCIGCVNQPGFCIDGCFAKFHGYA